MTWWPNVMITGHRKFTSDEGYFVQTEIDRLVPLLRDEHGMTMGISGMALGADAMWAESLLIHRVPLWSFIPFPQQADRWPTPEQETWRSIRSMADQETVVANEFSVQNLHARNHAMLDVADLVVAAFRPRANRGGTAACVREARRRGKPIVTIDVDRLSTTISVPL